VEEKENIIASQGTAAGGEETSRTGSVNAQPLAVEIQKDARIIPIEKLDISRLMQLDACTRCGECLNWCPVYDQDKREDIIPRTKVRDFYRIIKGQHGLLARILS